MNEIQRLLEEKARLYKVLEERENNKKRVSRMSDSELFEYVDYGNKVKEQLLAVVKAAKISDYEKEVARIWG